MQGIYTHISETNYVPREYGAAAILLLLFMVLISLVSVLNLLYFYIGTFRSMCAVPNMAVFCSSLTSWYPGMLFTYFLNDFEIVPGAPIITGITFVFTFHMRRISIIIIIIIIIIILLLSLLRYCFTRSLVHTARRQCHFCAPYHYRNFPVCLANCDACEELSTTEYVFGNHGFYSVQFEALLTKEHRPTENRVSSVDTVTSYELDNRGIGFGSPLETKRILSSPAFRLPMSCLEERLVKCTSKFWDTL